MRFILFLFIILITSVTYGQTPVKNKTQTYEQAILSERFPVIIIVIDNGDTIEVVSVHTKALRSKSIEAIIRAATGRNPVPGKIVPKTK